MKTIDQSAIRKHNLQRILELLTLSAPQTRFELAKVTGLSLMSVSNLVDVLRENGMVTAFSPREGKTASRRHAVGRRAETISLCGSHHAWLMADISGRQFRLTLVAFDASLLLTLTDDAKGSFLDRTDAFWTDIRTKISAALMGRELLGVAIVTPGPYEIMRDTVTNQRLPELNKVPIKAFFRERLGDYAYYVDEDVKFAVRAFSAQPACSGSEVLYYLLIGEGVGGAAVHNGNVLRGLNASAGDAGQLPSRSGGIFEDAVSLPAFAKALGLNPSLAPKKQLELLSAFAENDPNMYLSSLAEAAKKVADMLYSVIWMLDPAKIMIECRYAVPYEKEFVRSVAETLSFRFPSPARSFPDILTAPHEMSSVLRGSISVLQREWVERSLT